MTPFNKAAAHYRPDIDGLRAIAVLAVVAFHADMRQFHGGFIGVDVFFVISGYLISGIIFRALDKNNFSFTEFYVRRINRIFPALIIVLLGAWAIGWTILFSNEFRAVGKQMLAGAGFSSNFLLWSEAGYFDSARKPLLHLWSLGVEEQYYILWPLASVILWKGRQHLEVSTLLIVVTSFALNVWQASGRNGVASFYSPLTRVWELSSGTILFLLHWRDKRGSVQALSSLKFLSAAASFLGIALFAVALWKIDRDTPWPGWFALLPVVATVLMVAAGPRAPVNRFLLSNPLLVGIGLISYPLYLWHWPLLVFAKFLYWGAVPWRARMVAIVVAFMLAYATYRLAEVPVRSGTRKRRSALILATAMCGVAALALMVTHGGIEPRLHAYSAPELAWNDWGYPEGKNIVAGAHVRMNRLPGDSTRTVVLIGDSHMEQYFPRFELLSKSHGYAGPAAQFLTYKGCPPLPGLNRSGIAWHGGHFECDAFIEHALRIASAPNVSSVVVTAFWNGYWDGRMYSTTDKARRSLTEHSPSTDTAFNRLEISLTAMTRAGKKVYLILENVSGAQFNPESFFPARFPGFPAGKAIDAVREAAYIARTSAMRERLRGIARRAGATVLDPVPYLCPHGSCPTHDEAGLPIYRDEDHMRASFVRNKIHFVDGILSLPR